MSAAARLRSLAPVALVLAACARSAPDEEVARRSGAALSFSDGSNDGYTGSSLGAKQIALTFDDGPGSRALELSAWLRGRGIRATWFVNGHCFGDSVYSNGQCQQDANAAPGDVLGQIEADGHLVGNHTQDHYDLTSLGDPQIVSELADTDAIISPFVDSGHFVFRAPFGYWSSHDYDVLHASAMDKYVGPVRWDIGGQMTSRYAADWDCWQNADGYGVLTSKECGDRYLNEIGDLGSGIVLMHDADYGDPSNHSLTSGEGNTVDMAMYVIPILQQQGYTFVRLDEVPDIASAFGSPPPPPPPPPPPSDGGACDWDPTWSQTQYANTWWIEYAISGSVASASLEVVGGATTTLSESYGKWVGGPPSEIPSGTQVFLHATDTAGHSAQTGAFGYLVTTNPTTSCGSPPPPPPPPPPSDGGACSFDPTWTQSQYENTWWIDYAISGNVASASLEVVGGQTVALSLDTGTWVASPPSEITSGTQVILHAKDASGRSAQTNAFGYLVTESPTTGSCQ